MKTKLVPLALLIPAVVLAQPASPQNQPVAPQPGTMQNLSAKPPNPAEALSNAKKQAKELKSKLPSNGDVGNSGNGTCSNTTSECYYTGGSSSSHYGY
jgi:hypothetical protein